MKEMPIISFDILLMDYSLKYLKWFTCTAPPPKFDNIMSSTF